MTQLEITNKNCYNTNPDVFVSTVNIICFLRKIDKSHYLATLITTTFRTMEIYQALYDEPAIELFEFLNSKNESDWFNSVYVQSNVYSKLTMGVIKKYPDIQWNWQAVCHYSIITIDDIRNHPNLNHWNVLPMNTHIEIEDMLKNQDLPWNWYNINRYHYIDFQHVMDYPDLPWNWNELMVYRCYIPDNNMNFIMQNLDKPWNWNDISKNTHENYITNYPNLPWNWNMISRNNSITLKFIKQNLDKPWDWDLVANQHCEHYKFKHIATRNMLCMLVATIHEYYTDENNYKTPLSQIELFFADAYLVKYVMYAMNNKYFEMLEEFL